MVSIRSIVSTKLSRFDQCYSTQHDNTWKWFVYLISWTVSDPTGGYSWSSHRSTCSNTWNDNTRQRICRRSAVYRIQTRYSRGLLKKKAESGKKRVWIMILTIFRVRWTIFKWRRIRRFCQAWKVYVLMTMEWNRTTLHGIQFGWWSNAVLGFDSYTDLKWPGQIYGNCLVPFKIMETAGRRSSEAVLTD